jgi:hypothetical protein
LFFGDAKSFGGGIEMRLLSLGLTTVALAAGLGGAMAQSLPSNFAPRCLPNELRASPAADPCGEEFATFGLRGPRIVSAGARDVETTGSTSNPRRGDERPPRR